MKRRIALTMAALLVAVASTGFAQAPLVIRFSHVVAVNTPKGKGAERFKQLAEKAGGGRIKVEVFPNSTLYKDKEELEALQIGAVQMLAPSLAKFGPLGVKEFEVFDLPYIFPTEASLHRVTQGPVGQEMFKLLEPKGITGLAYWDNGFKVMHANKILKAPADFRGMKMRIQSSRVLDAQMRALGANPQVLAFSEVYQALQTGVVDGAENPPSNVYSQKMHEVQKYISLTNHGVIEYAVITNTKFWNGLPPDIRKILETALNEATVYANSIAAQENQDAIDAMKKSGLTTIYTPTAAEKEALRVALLPVHKEMEGRIGKDLLAKINKAVAEPPAGK